MEGAVILMDNTSLLSLWGLIFFLSVKVEVKREWKVGERRRMGKEGGEGGWGRREGKKDGKGGWGRRIGKEDEWGERGLV